MFYKIYTKKLGYIKIKNDDSPFFLFSLYSYCISCTCLAVTLGSEAIYTNTNVAIQQDNREDRTYATEQQCQVQHSGPCFHVRPPLQNQYKIPHHQTHR